MAASPRLCLALIFSLPICLTAADWPQFRGAGGSGISDDTGLPETWNATTNIVWKTELPGPGASSPVTFGDKIFLTCYSGYGTDRRTPGDPSALTYHVVCISRKDGKILWDKKMTSASERSGYRGFTALHGYASGTPAVDESGVYVSFANNGMSAWSHDGEQLWKTDVGSGKHGWGAGTSPILHGELVIVNASIESGAMIALDRKTGEEVWRQKGISQSWNTPIIVDANGKAELVVSVHSHIKAFDAGKGTPLWNCAGIRDYVCPSVIADDGVVYAIGGRKKTALAVRAGGKGSVTESHREWVIDMGSNVSSPVYHEGYLYWAHDSQGIVYCVNAKTGEVAYQERLNPRPRQIYASPVVADGRIYYVSRATGTFVLPAKPEYKVLAHNVIATDKSICNASPAVSNGQLLLRSDTHLYCIGK